MSRENSIEVRLGSYTRSVSKAYTINMVRDLIWGSMSNTLIEASLVYATGTYPLATEFFNNSLSKYNPLYIELKVRNQTCGVIEPMNEDNKKFWMVQAVPGGVAQAVHQSKSEAEGEAVRLAGLACNHNKQLYVLEAVSVHQVSAPPVVSKEL